MFNISVERAGWSRAQWWLVVLLAIAGILYACTRKLTLTFSDEFAYASIALHLRHDHFFSLDGLAPTATRPPGYPWLLTTLPDVRLAKAVNILFWFLSAVATAGIARKIFGRTAATVCLIFDLIFVVELYTAGTLFPQAFASFLFLGSLWLHFVWRRRGSNAEYAVQSCLWSLLILTVPLFLVNFALFLAWDLWKRRKLMQVALTALIVCLAISAWALRNQREFGSFFVSDNSGLMLILGNSELTGPNTGPTLPLDRMAPGVWAQKDEFARDNGYKRLAVAWIRAHPRRATTLYAEKTLNWFGCGTNLKTAGSDKRGYVFVIGGVYYPMLVLALLSFVLLPAFRKVEVYFGVQYLSSALAYAVFFTRVRYRLPYDYLLMVLAAAAVAHVLRARTEKTRPVRREEGEAVPVELGANFSPPEIARL